MAGTIWPVDAVTGAPTFAGRALRETTVSPFVAMGAGTRPLGGLSGVRPGTPNTIVTATSTTWTVTPFGGVIDGATAAIAGTYAYAFSTNQTGSVTAAGASARVDRLDVQVIDPAEGGVSGANPLIQIVYTVGAPGLQAAPAQSHPLAQINVPISGGGSPTVTWSASYNAGAGGYVPFNVLTGSTGLQGWTTAAPNQHASVINDPTTANNGDYTFNGSTWVPSEYASAAGSAAFSLVSTSSQIIGITFPTGRFSQAPFLLASMQSSPGTARKLNIQTASITTAGASIIASTGDGSSITSGGFSVGWYAVQMASTSAAG